MNLTDQELNEWVNDNILKWKQDITTAHWFDESGVICIDTPNPCYNLNHTYLMEEKISTDDQQWLRYGMTLYDHIPPVKICDLSIHGLLMVVHATARQRCEAAYLLFNEDSVQLRSETEGDHGKSCA